MKYAPTDTVERQQTAGIEVIVLRTYAQQTDYTTDTGGEFSNSALSPLAGPGESVLLSAGTQVQSDLRKHFVTSSKTAYKTLGHLWMALNGNRHKCKPGLRVWIELDGYRRAAGASKTTGCTF